MQSFLLLHLESKYYAALLSNLQTVEWVEVTRLIVIAVCELWAGNWSHNLNHCRETDGDRQEDVNCLPQLQSWLEWKRVSQHQRWSLPGELSDCKLPASYSLSLTSGPSSRIMATSSSLTVTSSSSSLWHLTRQVILMGENSGKPLSNSGRQSSQFEDKGSLGQWSQDGQNLQEPAKKSWLQPSRVLRVNPG